MQLFKNVDKLDSKLPLTIALYRNIGTKYIIDDTNENFSITSESITNGDNTIEFEITIEDGKVKMNYIITSKDGKKSRMSFHKDNCDCPEYNLIFELADKIKIDCSQLPKSLINYIAIHNGVSKRKVTLW